jgi:hypothetical protein
MAPFTSPVASNSCRFQQVASMRIMQKRLVYLDCKSLADAVYIVNRSLQDKESSDHCDWYEKGGGYLHQGK